MVEVHSEDDWILPVKEKGKYRDAEMHTYTDMYRYTTDNGALGKT